MDQGWQGCTAASILHSPAQTDCQCGHRAWVLHGLVQRIRLLRSPAVCLVLHGFINMMSAHGIARFMAFSGAYQLVAAVAVIVLIPIIAPQHQSPEFVFRSFEDTTQTTGAPSTPYVAHP